MKPCNPKCNKWFMFSKKIWLINITDIITLRGIKKIKAFADCVIVKSITK